MMRKKKYYEKNLSRDEYGNRKRGRHKILHRHTHTHTHTLLSCWRIFSKYYFVMMCIWLPGAVYTVREFIQSDVPPRLVPFGMPSHHITNDTQWK